MSSPTLSEQLDQEARERAIEKFGPNPTPEQFQRVRKCEWDIFTFHAATGGDADCWCGAHVSSLRPEAPSRGPSGESAAS